MNDKKLLEEVVIIRPLLILCIIIGHSFALYSGAWPVPGELFPTYPILYKYINPLFISFQLAAFVFISGYVYEYVRNLRGDESTIVFLGKKIKRIYLPAIFFGTIYYFLFLFDCETFSFVKCAKKIILGVGHLWFLPMLFMCFCVIRFLDGKIKQNLLLLLLLCMALLPFQFMLYTQFLHYIFYFYLGCIMQRRNIKLRIEGEKNVIYCCCFVFFCFWIVYISINNDKLLLWNNFYTDHTIESLLGLLVINGVKLAMCISGILFIYTFFCYILYKGYFYINSFVSFSNKICYGMYILHQFVLYMLVYELNNIIDPDFWDTIYPFIILIITILSSLLLSCLMLKTRLGRFLIG